MTELRVLRTEQAAEWHDVLARCGPYDFYHLPQYHALAEDQGEGAGHLFVYTEGGYTVALPLLLRPLEAVPGLAPVGPAGRDATSVYGNAGPVASHPALPDEVVRNFQAALHGRLRELGVVAVFSRLHPLLPQRGLLEGLGECKALAPTVSIDLSLPPDLQRARYRRNHKEGINRLRRLGVSCLHDRERRHLPEFIQLYFETMRRVHAAGSYFFPPAYFEGLCSRLGEHMHLFVCLLEGRVICGGLFGACGGIVQYHLGGTLDDFLKLAPMKLLTDEVRLWGTGQGFGVFHLGGGATPRPDDSLLHFKAGFSDRRHDFCVWRWVLFPDIYTQLCRGKLLWNERNRLRPTLAEYFPAYRCPTVPAV